MSFGSLCQILVSETHVNPETLLFAPFKHVDRGAKRSETLLNLVSLSLLWAFEAWAYSLGSKGEVAVLICRFCGCCGE
jgi:hypothetical protein